MQGQKNISSVLLPPPAPISKSFHIFSGRQKKDENKRLEIYFGHGNGKRLNNAKAAAAAKTWPALKFGGNKTWPD